MKHRRSWPKRIITLQLLIGFAACTLILSGIASAFSVTFDTAWESRFQRTSGWTGADGIQSIDLLDGRVLFLFGDTWIGPIVDHHRGANAQLVHNSIAAYDRGSGITNPIHFYWNQQVRSKNPRAWVETDSCAQRRKHVPASRKAPRSTDWFWPLGDGIVLPDQNGKMRLLMFWERLALDHQQKPPWNFRTAGSTLVIVNDMEKGISRWHPVCLPIPYRTDNRRIPGSQKSSSLCWGMALVAGDKAMDPNGFLYIYGVRQTDGAPNDLVLARAPMDAPENFERWQFLTRDGWKSSPEELTSLCDSITNEFSIDRMSENPDQYVLIQSDPFFRNEIWMRKASQPEGPFSAPAVVFSAASLAQCSGCFAYAAKAHRFLSDPNDLLISFVVNSTHFDILRTDTDIYRPRFIRLSLEGVIP
ncbi:DUF5005 domain-containing protein [Desulfatirhabdium butyrativorans]|uniref:DUF5005 domain-containing protein n=1 Tax=Desulfatirhabdium butyrativorans TaxID=340467 RepID=UPI0012EB5ACB|nr:DUF5005 domain-containing protein [Desulfatirhabdium butyrativorans]